MIAGGNDPEALFMWNALAVVTTALGYTHLTPEKVFEHLKDGTRPETKDEDIFGPHDIITSRQCRNR